MVTQDRVHIFTVLNKARSRKIRVMLDNIDVLKMLKRLTEISNEFEVLNESTQERITEYLDTQIAIEEDVNFDPFKTGKL